MPRLPYKFERLRAWGPLFSTIGIASHRPRLPAMVSAGGVFSSPRPTTSHNPCSEMRNNGTMGSGRGKNGYSGRMQFVGIVFVFSSEGVRAIRRRFALQGDCCRWCASGAVRRIGATGGWQIWRRRGCEWYLDRFVVG